MMLKIVKNSAKEYVINTLTNRVVVWNTNGKSIDYFRSLIPSQYYDTAHHCKNIKYEVKHFNNEDGKISEAFCSELKFSNVTYLDKTVKTFVEGAFCEDCIALAEKYKRVLEEYQIKLF